MNAFVSAFKIALEEQMQGELPSPEPAGLPSPAEPGGLPGAEPGGLPGPVESAEPETVDFDITSLLKGVLMELQSMDDPVAAMEAAMGKLKEDPQCYATLEITESEEHEEHEEEEDVEEVEEVEEGEPTPGIISSKLIQIANTIDNSDKPSKRQILTALKKIRASILRHPHLAAEECGECGKKGGEHAGWCPIKGEGTEEDVECGECGKKGGHRGWCPLAK